MRVTDVAVDETPRGTLLAGTVVWDDRRRGVDRIEFLYRDTRADAVVTPGDAMLAAVLVLAVAVGEDLTLDVPVSSRLLKAAPRIAEQLVASVPGWHRIGVDAPAADRSALAPTEVAAGFSGGVDSFYTVLRPRAEPVTLLLTSHGLEFENLVPQLEPLMQRLAGAAAAYGKKHVIVETNAYSTGRKHLPWSGPRGVAITGPLVMAQALGLGGVIRRFHVAATRAPNEARPDFVGTAPEIDPLLSTESLEVVHDGSAERDEKIRTIAVYPEVLDTLQVCLKRRRMLDNCNECDKCVATALTLEIIGVIDRCRTLKRVSPEIVRKTRINPNWVHTFTRLLGQVDDQKMRRAIVSALRTARLRRPLRPLGRRLRRAGLRLGPL